ncbi:MAG: hypothetical protein AAGC63_04065 [Propionicimonas sp.]|nr:hypothetical protein [Propionicimonas sp.]
MSRRLPTPPIPAGGRLLDARLSLLDRQVLDVDGEPVGVVDDLELSDPQAGVLPDDAVAPVVRHLVHGPVVLDRITGGRHPRAHFERIEWAAVAEIGPALRLAVGSSRVPVGWLEDWLARNVVARIPGGRHVPR